MYMITLYRCIQVDDDDDDDDDMGLAHTLT